MAEDDCGFVIFSGNKLWYSSKEGIENTICKNKNVKGSSKIRNSAKTRKTIVHPIFEKYSKEETDPFWISFFTDLSVGSFPRNSRFVNNTIIYRFKNKNIELSLVEDDILSIQSIKNFFSDNVGIISPIDLKNKKVEEEKRIAEMTENETISWSQIRSDRQQTIMISFFVENIGQYYSLNLIERKNLIQLIKIGVLAGYFNTENIKIEGGQISYIEGLEYDEETRQFNINKDICRPIKSIKKNTYDETTIEAEEGSIGEVKKNLTKHWHKYLNDLYKKVN